MPPKSNTERQKLYRERQKEKLGAGWNKQEAARKIKAWNNDIQKSREYHKAKMRKQRLKPGSPSTCNTLQETPVAGTPRAYSRISSLSRAIARVKDQLPKSPRKRKSIIKALSTEYPVSEITPAAKPRPGPRTFSSEVISRINDFYHRQDMVFTTPGLKDCKTVIINGKKVNGFPKTQNIH